jgi:hypothetical protein
MKTLLINLLVSKMRTGALAVGGVLIAASVLSACGGGGGSGNSRSTNEIPNGNDGGFVYQGPAASTDDVQRFRVELWDNIRLDSRCGQCHDETTGQQPMFARTDDINLAYQAANTVVDLTSPADSRMVQKFVEGHVCWETSDAACADILTRWISNWAAVAGTGAKSIVLTPPSSLRDPGSSKNFPASSAGFSDIHTLLTTYCSGCHSDTAQTRQQPYFASSDIDVAYEAAKSKINLNEPANSRLVVRLRDEFHNCWSNCANNAADMLAAIQAFADDIETTGVDESLVISKAQSLSEGIIAASGGRFENNMIALYEFKPDDTKPGGGTIAYDTSGVDPSMNMTLNGEYAWVGGWGVRFSGTGNGAGRAQAQVADSGKLYNLITSTGEYSIEAWVAPANVTQEETSIISYSGGVDKRNFTLGQTLYDYEFYLRESTTNESGMPFLTTNPAGEILQATLQHVVVTFSGANKRRIYVNGQLVDVQDETDAGNFSSWSNSFAFVVGNEGSQRMPWSGVVRMVAVFNRALTPEQINQNYQAGVGEKFFLLFSVSEHVDKPNVFVVFEVSRFDDYGYLFNAPFVVSLSDEPLDNVTLRGMRIGVNGKLANVGQAYQRLNMAIDSDNADEEGHIPLSSIGTVIGTEVSEEGAEDEFFLQFDQIGADTHVIVEADPAPAAPPVDLEPQARIGIRTFEEINVTMATITGVSRTNADVMATYERVKQQLPTKESVEGFLSAHQMAITQMAIEYCNALVENTSLRATFFPGFNFGAAPATALNSGGRTALISPLLSKAVGSNLATQPLDSDIEDELNDLIDRLSNCGGSCNATRTQTIAKAVCSTVIGSATMLLQ